MFGRRNRASAKVLALTGLVALLPVVAMADETVETTDGRKLLLRSDGIYEFLSRLDPKVINAAIATTKGWAQDQTLVLYCFRKQPNRELLARAIAKDREEALARLRRAGATAQQLRQVADIIATELRETAADAENEAMTEACTARDVEKSVESLREIAWPLWMRSPFKEMK